MSHWLVIEGALRKLQLHDKNNFKIIYKDFEK